MTTEYKQSRRDEINGENPTGNEPHHQNARDLQVSQQNFRIAEHRYLFRVPLEVRAVDSSRLYCFEYALPNTEIAVGQGAQRVVTDSSGRWTIIRRDA